MKNMRLKLARVEMNLSQEELAANHPLYIQHNRCILRLLCS